MSKVIVFVLALLLPASVYAQNVGGYVEFEEVVVDSTRTPQINFFAKGPINKKIGWSVWTLTTQVWAESYGGLTYAPADWVELSASVGLEVAKKSAERYSLGLWVGKNRFALSSNIENGGSGEWHKNVATIQLSQKFAIGGFNQTAVGTGPYAEMKLKKVLAWGTWLGGKNIAVGSRYNF